MQGVEPKGRGDAGGPMAGIRVIDLGNHIAGPLVATLLGEFGADVIKVELPEVGDTYRALAPNVKGVPAHWASLSRNKRSISLDVRKENGKEILKRLVATADLMVENYRPGTLERWGLGFDVLKRVNRRIILVRVSGYGQTGPHAHKGSFALVASAFSGLTFLQGYPDRPPVGPPAALLDYLAGVFGAMGASMALHHMRAHPEAEGQVVDVSLYESAFRLLEQMVSDYDLVRRVRQRGGHIAQGSVPAGSFQCQDGEWVVMVTANDRTFKRLTEVMGRPDLLSDPRFDTSAHRSAHREEISAVVQEWFSCHPAEKVLALLEKGGVPCSRINSVVEVFEDPQFRARENLIDVLHPILGKLTVMGIIPKFSATPGSFRTPGPIAIGEHNREIYQGELGLTPEELEALEAEGVI